MGFGGGGEGHGEEQRFGSFSYSLIGVVQSHVNIEHQYFCFVLFVLSFGMFKICLVPSKKGRLSGPLYPATCCSRAACPSLLPLPCKSCEIAGKPCEIAGSLSHMLPPLFFRVTPSL